MNIFFVHHEPLVAASMLSDKHVVKMILESAQLLSTAHRVLDGTKTTIVNKGRKKTVYKLDGSLDETLYSATHVNHPSAVWARQTAINYAWLLLHFKGLLCEYTTRYKKEHACSKLAAILSQVPQNISTEPLTIPPCAMDDQYKIHANPVSMKEVVENYRNYYIIGKAAINKWQHSPTPDFITKGTYYYD